MVPRHALAMGAGISLSACGLISGLDSLATSDLAPSVEDAGGPARAEREDGGRGDDSAASGPDHEDIEAGPPQGLPPAGTYTYTAVGYDKITGIISPPQSNYGPTATVTIVHVGDRCFDQTIHLRGNYDQTMRLCLRKEPDLGRESLVHESGSRTQKFGVLGSATTTQACAPGNVHFNGQPPPDKSWAHDCTGKNSDDKSGSDSEFRTKGGYRFVGRETISVGGIDVPVLHFAESLEVTGAQTGTDSSHWYYSAVDGLLVRLKDRSTSITYGSFATYTEVVTDMTLSVLPDGGVE